MSEAHRGIPSPAGLSTARLSGSRNLYGFPRR